MRLAKLLLGLLLAAGLGAWTHGTGGGSGAIPTLVPSAGWAGATSTPAAQGSSGNPGYAEPAIAGWDTVPFQTIAAGQTLQVCVVAFHIYGIDHVSFGVQGGAFANATATTTTETGNQTEYCANITGTSFSSDGLIEVRAIAYPTTGVPFVLQGGSPSSTTILVTSVSSLYLYAAPLGTRVPYTAYVSTTGTDAGTTCTSGSPCRTISYAKEVVWAQQGSSDIGGGTVCINGNGDYNYGSGADSARAAPYQWLTVMPCGSATQAGVRITVAPGLAVEKAHLKGLTVYGVKVNDLNIDVGGKWAYMWADNIIYDGITAYGASVIDRPFASSWQTNYYQLFYTDGTYQNIGNGPINGNLVRGTTVNTIGSDAFQTSQVVVNNTVTNLAVYVSQSFTVTGQASAVITVSGDTSHVVDGSYAVGTNLSSSCNAASPITVLSHTGTTVTLSSAPTGSITTLPLDTCAHPDVWQILGSGNIANNIFYHNTAVTNVAGQGVFPAQTGTLSSLAVVGNTLNTGATADVVQIDFSTNVLFQDNTLTGVYVLKTGGTWVDSVIRNDVCSPGGQSATIAGITKINTNC